MARVSRGRTAVLEILEAVDRGRRLDLALDRALGGVPERERAWVHELAYGVVRLRGRLDHLLDHHLHQGVGSVSPPLLHLLRMGAYQLLRMGGVPAYAAVSQTVEQARRRVSEGASRLANGVLRSLERGGGSEDVFPDRAADPAGHFSTWGSHPRWLVARWLERWSVDDVRALVEHDNRIPRLTIRVIGLEVEAARERLDAEGIGSELVGRGTRCLRLERGTDPASVLGLVPAVVQGPGAALVTAHAAPDPGSRIADLCAAPGGKGLALAGEARYVLAVDPSPRRLGLLRENRDRLHAVRERVGLAVARAQEPPVGRVDLVLLDVPCTGTGTLQAHPDARWRLEPDAVDQLARLQRAMLEGAAAVVGPGGVLVYSTCTLEPEENEEQVLSFLDRHREFELDPGPERLAPFLDERGFLRVLPQRTGFDGAFAARLRRRR